MSESEVPEPPDPPRWSSGGGPPGSLDLLSTLERVPVIPPAIRHTVPRNPGPLRPPWVRTFGAVTATALVIGGIVLWVLPRAEPVVAVRSIAAPEVVPAVPPEVPVAPEVPEVPEVTAEVATEVVPEAVPPSALPAEGGPPRAAPPSRTSPSPGAPVAPEETAAAPAPPSVPPCVPGGEGLGGRGTLGIQTLPWARLFIDGHDTGRNTPIHEYAISAGCHRIGLRAPDGTTHEFTIEVADGARIRIVRHF